jgi:regulatory protein
LIITKIQRLRGKRGRYSVYLNGSQAFELSELIIGRTGLCTGDEIDSKEIGRIREKEAELQAKNTAINFLSYRQRSSHEVLGHLLKKGFTRERSQKTVDRLRKLNMINDLNFAYAFARDRLKRGQTGQILLRRQLLAKGIGSDVADKVLAELISDSSEESSAFKAVRKKLKGIRPVSGAIDTGKQKKRILDFLLRHGYTYDIAIRTINRTIDR